MTSKNESLHKRRGFFCIKGSALLNKAHELVPLFSKLDFVPTSITECWRDGQYYIKYHGLSNKFDLIRDKIEPIEYDVSVVDGKVKLIRYVDKLVDIAS
jgi:hypothetical protein